MSKLIDERSPKVRRGRIVRLLLVITIAVSAIFLFLRAALPALKYLDIVTFRHNHIIPLSWYAADLSHPSRDVRVKAAMAIQRRAYDADVSRYLVLSLTYPDALVRRAAIEGIVTSRTYVGRLTVSDDILVQDLTNIVECDDNNEVRLKALNALVWLRDKAFTDEAMIDSINHTVKTAHGQAWLKEMVGNTPLSGQLREHLGRPPAATSAPSGRQSHEQEGTIER